MSEERKADVQTLVELRDGIGSVSKSKGALNRAIESLEMEIQMDEEFSEEASPSTEALIDGSWERLKVMTGSWQCKDFADGWVTFRSISEAIDYQLKTGCIMRPLRGSPSPNTS